mmetsp:Transcript_2088/g.5976  ORF Transcript_2088/g.5976 Transcript_2088/m.5976 type:complete len:226 (-) Transcript_2088:308-985(-)
MRHPPRRAAAATERRVCRAPVGTRHQRPETSQRPDSDDVVEVVGRETERHLALLQRLLDGLVGWAALLPLQERLPALALRRKVARRPAERVAELQADARAAADVLTQRVHVHKAERGQLLLQRRLAAERVAQRAEQTALARERVKGVVALAPLRVDHEQRPRTALAAKLADRGEPVRRRLDEANAVVLRLRGLREPDALAVDARHVQPLLVERRRYAGHLRGEAA